MSPSANHAPHPAIACPICDAPASRWLAKPFPDPELGTVEYARCTRCGFVTATTITDLPAEQWAAVNARFHAAYQGSENDPNDPSWQRRLEAQAEVIADLSAAGLISNDRPWVDYGCGDGKLSALLAARRTPRLLNFEPYMTRPGYLERAALVPGGFSFVITTSVFEHLRSRAQMDEIAGLVGAGGVMGLHTLVAEAIPADPNWFYFLPVHCSFFSNASMQVLFDRWGYRSSLYHVGSRLWFWFKADPDHVEQTVAKLNQRSPAEPDRYHFKRGFVDYWKLRPQDVMARRSLTA